MVDAQERDSVLPRVALPVGNGRPARRWRIHVETMASEVDEPRPADYLGVIGAVELSRGDFAVRTRCRRDRSDLHTRRDRRRTGIRSDNGVVRAIADASRMVAVAAGGDGTFAEPTGHRQKCGAESCCGYAVDVLRGAAGVFRVGDRDSNLDERTLATHHATTVPSNVSRFGHRHVCTGDGWRFVDRQGGRHAQFDVDAGTRIEFDFDLCDRHGVADSPTAAIRETRQPAIGRDVADSTRGDGHGGCGGAGVASTRLTSGGGTVELRVARVCCVCSKTARFALPVHGIFGAGVPGWVSHAQWHDCRGDVAGTDRHILAGSQQCRAVDHRDFDWVDRQILSQRSSRRRFGQIHRERCRPNVAGSAGGASRGIPRE